MRQLISKLVAGGLSAAVILLWWPRFFPADNATTWLIRGVVWTLSFELLLHALMPIENALWDSHAGRRVRTGASKAGERLGSPRRSSRGRAVVACLALAVPLAMLTFAPAQPAKSTAAAPVRHVTEVKRIVRVERRQVRVAKIVPVPAAAAQASLVSHAPRAAERSRTTKPVTRKPESTPRDSGGKQTPATGDGVAAPQDGSGTGSQSATEGTQQRTVQAPRVVRRADAA